MGKMTDGWNKDMSSAPHGEIVKVGERNVRGEGVAAINKFMKAYVLLSIVDKGVAKTVCTYRTEGTKQNPTGYWAGCSTTQEVRAWRPMPDPLP